MRGNIQFESAYHQGKMLNHSGWDGILPRNITPSDIDFVIDVAGKILCCELSRQTNDWGHLFEASRGQALLHVSLVQAGRGDIVSVLAHHNTPVRQQIDTLRGIDSFHVLYWQKEHLNWTDIIQGNELWQKFVKNYSKMF